MLLAGIYLLSGFPAMDRLLVMLKRLRWLMLAIVLVYGWWTPGAALFPVAGVLSPTVEGLQLGLIRMATVYTSVLPAGQVAYSCTYRIVHGGGRPDTATVVQGIVRAFPGK
jgi:energy-coupling factor transport system permease protein